MSFNLDDKVWWFCCDSTKGNVYPDWLDLCEGRVVWKSPYEEIMHVYCEGSTYIHVLLDDDQHIFRTKENALFAMSARLREIEDGKSTN